MTHCGDVKSDYYWCDNRRNPMDIIEQNKLKTRFIRLTLKELVTAQCALKPQLKNEQRIFSKKEYDANNGDTKTRTEWNKYTYYTNSDISTHRDYHIKTSRSLQFDVNMNKIKITVLHIMLAKLRNKVHGKFNMVPYESIIGKFEKKFQAWLATQETPETVKV
jgi:hypothetical protein